VYFQIEKDIQLLIECPK